MRQAADTSAIRHKRMQPIPRPCSAASITTIVLLSISRPRLPFSGPPTYVSSSSTVPPSASRPGRLAAAEPEHPLQAERADAGLPAGHEPHRLDPGSERLTRAVEKSASGERGAAVTTPAAPQLVRHRPGLTAHPAMRADAALGPAQSSTVGSASSVVPEPLVQRLKRMRIVDPRTRLRGTPNSTSARVGEGDTFFARKWRGEQDVPGGGRCGRSRCMASSGGWLAGVFCGLGSA